jgi:hypothetical protein
MRLARPDFGCLRTIGFVRSDLSNFVPADGLNDRSQAIYCLVSVEDGNRPVGHGMIGSGRLARSGTINRPRGRDQTVPPGRVASLHTSQAMNCLAMVILSLQDGSFPAHNPVNKLSRYDQQSLRDPSDRRPRNSLLNSRPWRSCAR